MTLPGIQGGEPVVSREAHLEFSWHPVADLREVNLKPEPAIAPIGAGGPVWASTLAAGGTPSHSRGHPDVPA